VRKDLEMLKSSVLMMWAFFIEDKSEINPIIDLSLLPAALSQA
jgi:hypothetical protein